MSLGLSRGARKSERVIALIYERLCAFLCITCVTMDHCARVWLWVRTTGSINSMFRGKYYSAFVFIGEKNSVLKFNQRR